MVCGTVIGDGDRDAAQSRVEVPAPTRVSLAVPVALGPDQETARRLAAWWLSDYTTRMGPLYPRMLAERFGMAVGVNAVIEAANGNPRPHLPAVAEDLAREVTLMGTYDQAKNRSLHGLLPAPTACSSFFRPIAQRTSSPRL